MKVGQTNRKMKEPQKKAQESENHSYTHSVILEKY